MEFHGSGESEALRAVGAERGFVLTQSPVQHLQGWMSSACWFLLMGAGASPGIPLEFLLPTPAGGSQHSPHPRSQQAAELGKHQKLSEHPKLRFTELSDSLPELFPSSSEQIHPAPSPPRQPGCRVCLHRGPWLCLGLGAPFLPHPP